MQSKPTSAVTKGIIISLILIVITLISFFLDLDPKSGLQYVGYIIFLGGIIWGILNYAKQVDYNATFGKYFVHGFSITAIVTVFMVIFIILLLVFYPDMKTKALEKVSEELQKQSTLTPDQRNMQMDITKRFFTPMLVGMTLLGYIFFGVIASLIGAAVAKKNPRPVFDDEIKTIG